MRQQTPLCQFQGHGELVLGQRPLGAGIGLFQVGNLSQVRLPQRQHHRRVVAVRERYRQGGWVEVGRVRAALNR